MPLNYSHSTSFSVLSKYVALKISAVYVIIYVWVETIYWKCSISYSQIGSMVNKLHRLRNIFWQSRKHFLALQWWQYHTAFSNQIISGSAEMSFCKHANTNRILRLSDMIDIFALTSSVSKLISYRVHFQFSLFVLLYAMKAPFKAFFFLLQRRKIKNKIKKDKLKIQKEKNELINKSFSSIARKIGKDVRVVYLYTNANFGERLIHLTRNLVTLLSTCISSSLVNLYCYFNQFSPTETPTHTNIVLFILMLVELIRPLAKENANLPGN